MVKLYKNRQMNGNGEIVVVTDAKDMREFIPQLAEATLRAMEQHEGDHEDTIKSILENSFEVAFKLQGYKSERVYEQKLLTCGFSSPDECEVIADTSNQSGPLTKEAILARIAVDAMTEKPNAAEQKE